VPVRAGYRRRRLSLTPLIDVIFLLLLFFMLSSTFTPFAELQLGAASAGAAARDTPPLFLRVTEEALALNGRDVPMEALAAEAAYIPLHAQAVIVATRAGLDYEVMADETTLAVNVTRAE
jgi:biopolymer transport protein ExbD